MKFCVPEFGDALKSQKKNCTLKIRSFKYDLFNMGVNSCIDQISENFIENWETRFIAFYQNDVSFPVKRWSHEFFTMFNSTRKRFRKCLKKEVEQVIYSVSSYLPSSLERLKNSIEHSAGGNEIRRTFNR